jgi:AAA+ ATPase superfamily predicted ATPase
MIFVNRKKELKALNDWWRVKLPQLIIIYGKRRVGKTELIKQFIKDKPAVYFLADKVGEKDNLKALSKSIGSFLKDSLLEKNGFGDWYDLFAYLKAKPERFILVIDEFPYLVETNKAISSVFQKGWDEYLKDAGLFLILSGSSIGMMEAETLSHKAALYGRRTGQILVKPLRFGEVKEFFPGRSFEDILRIHTVTGGIPAYILLLKQKGSFKKAVEQNLLSPQAYLYNEVEFILKEELREPRTYFSILRAIALGKQKFGEIVNETGLQKNIIMKYLGVLEDLHLLKKDLPITEKNPLRSKKNLYFIEDQFFVFWFNYIFPFKSELELGKTSGLWDKFSRGFNLSVSRNYERAAKDIVADHEGKFFPLLKIGRWWDRNEEIDIVAVNDEENKILFCEVKWSNKPVGTDIYDDLKRKAGLVEWGKPGRREFFALFSKSGFTPAMKSAAKKEKVTLFQGDREVGGLQK